MTRTDEDAAIRARLCRAVGDWLLKTGGTQRELAKTAKVNYGDLRKWTAPNLDRLPGLPDLARLAGTLGVSERYLLTGETPGTSTELQARVAGLELRMALIADYMDGLPVDSDAIRVRSQAS